MTSLFIKQANARALLALLQRLGPALGRNSGKIVDYGVPLAAGGTAATLAHQQGATPLETAGYGVGGALFSNPRTWKSLWAASKASANPLESLGMGALKQLPVKGLPIALTVGAERAPDIVKNISDATKGMADTSGNLSKITQEGAAPMIQATKNIEKGTGGLASLNTQLNENIPQMASGISRMSNSVSDLAETVKGMKNPLPGIGQSIKDTFVTPEGGLTNASKIGLGGGAGLLGLYALTKALSDRNRKRDRYE